jgi:hypothetical protein
LTPILKVVKMMKQAAKMQEQMAQTQAELAERTVTATAGGGKVTVVATGAGDVVSISNAINPANDGIYVVSNVSAASFPQTVTIKGVGTTSPNANTPWVQSQFVASTGDTARATKIDLQVTAVANGSAFNDGTGTPYAVGTLIQAYAAAATESDFTANGDYTAIGGSGSAETLQGAYDLGATITTASSTDIAFTLTSGGFTVDDGAVAFGSGTGSATFAAGSGFSASGFSPASSASFLAAGPSSSVSAAGFSSLALGFASGFCSVVTGVDAGFPHPASASAASAAIRASGVFMWFFFC